MLSTITRALRQQTFQCRRTFAQVVNVTASSSGSETHVSVPSVKSVDWRKGRIPAREDHGLYAFFRRKQPKDGEVLEGDARFEVLEVPNEMNTMSGRGWRASELMLKSFKDLHVLWYVLLRERNVLATQKEETRRMGVTNRAYQTNMTKLYHVRKSMARIKQVINERRLAYEAAFQIAQTEQDKVINDKVLAHLKKEHKIRSRRTIRAYKLKKAKDAVQEAKIAKDQRTPQEAAVDSAAAGLFGTSPPQ